MFFLINSGNASTYVERSFLIPLKFRISLIIGWVSFIFVSSSSEVEYCPDFVFFGFLLSCIISNRISPVCFGEEILNFFSANWYILFVIPSSFSDNSILKLCNIFLFIAIPSISILAKTINKGISIFLYKVSISLSFISFSNIL